MTSTGKSRNDCVRRATRIGLTLGLAIAATAAMGEVPPAESAPCFRGAYYRKAVSSNDMWTGIEGVIRLPEPDYDMTRLRPNGRPKDNASIYLGGRAGNQEIDAGLSWEVIRKPDGTVTTSGQAFRPFWRNAKWATGPAKPDFYYHPGDVVRMRIETAGDNKLRLSIDLLSRAEQTPAENANTATGTDKISSGKTEPAGAIAVKSSETATSTRDVLTTVPADAITSFSVVFDAPHFGPGRIQQFKRVNAIDQAGNEGKTVQGTSTRITGAEWRSVNLLREGKAVPMIPSRYTDMRCPTPDNIRVTPLPNSPSGERIDIIGQK